MIPNTLPNMGVAGLATSSPEARSVDGEADFALQLASALPGGEAVPAGTPEVMPEMPPLAEKLTQQIRDALESGTLPEGTALDGGQVQQLQQWLAQLNNSAEPQTPEQADALLTRLSVSADGMTGEEATTLLKSLIEGEGKTTLASINAATTSSGGHIPALVASALNIEKRRSGQEQAPVNDTLTQGKMPVQPEITEASRANVTALVQEPSLPQAGVTHETQPLNVALLRLAPEGGTTGHANALATASTNAAPVLSQPLGSAAWQQALGQQLAMFTRNGIHNAELRLHPQDLGALQLNIRMSQEQAQLHIVSDNHHVRAALEAAMPQLRTSLAEAGIELSQSSVSADNAAPWQDASGENRQGGDGEGGNGSGAGGSGQDEAEQTTVQTRTIMRPGGVDTFA
jgi:flagellar hook-length control protein FliK